MINLKNLLVLLALITVIAAGFPSQASASENSQPEIEEETSPGTPPVVQEYDDDEFSEETVPTTDSEEDTELESDSEEW